MHRVEVDFADLNASAVAAYRLGMAHTAPFLAALTTAQREELTAECVSAVTEAPRFSSSNEK